MVIVTIHFTIVVYVCDGNEGVLISPPPLHNVFNDVKNGFQNSPKLENGKKEKKQYLVYFSPSKNGLKFHVIQSICPIYEGLMLWIFFQSKRSFCS